MQSLDITRRNFLKTLGWSFASTTALSKAWASTGLGHIMDARDAGADISPIAGLSPGSWNSSDFNGDEIDRPHDLLWNIPGYLASKGGIPEPSESAQVVIVGGGISGLLSAYFLRDLKPVVLEQASRLGGNSKGERMGGSRYSIGAAYIVTPEKGSAIERTLQEIGILGHGRNEASEETSVVFRGRWTQEFWKGSTDPAQAADFIRVETKLKRILAESYPEIPYTADSKVSREEWARLDRMTFSGWLKEQLGAIHPHIEEYFQLYAWSSFGGSIDELSAAQMLNFLASETASVMAFPGGNSAIAAALSERLRTDMGPDRLRAGAISLDVASSAEGVQLCWEGSDRKLRSISAKACIVTTPKFVAKRIVNGIPKEQSEAMDWLRYRGYLVGNIFYRRQEAAPAFDIYRLAGEVPPAPMAMRQGDRSVTDVCSGDWASRSSDGEFGVLTLFRPLPFDGARQFLFNPQSHAKHQEQFREEAGRILDEWGIGRERLLGVRLTRWGHSLPLAENGVLAAGLPQLASRPVNGRVFFANQDNWVNPAFECVFEVARSTTEAVRHALGA